MQVKSESEIDTLFICKVTEGKIGMTLQMKTYVCTLGNVNILIGTAHLFDTCLFTMSEEAQLPVEEDETFCEVSCPSSQTLALPVAQSYHQAATN